MQSLRPYVCVVWFSGVCLVGGPRNPQEIWGGPAVPATHATTLLFLPDSWPCIPGSCPGLLFKREALPGSPQSDSSLLSSAGGEGSCPKDQTTPFRGWQTFLPPRFRLLPHHALMPLAKNKDKLPRSCIPHGPWIQLGFAVKVITGSVGCQPLAPRLLAPSSPAAPRPLTLPEGCCWLGQSLAQDCSFGEIPRQM